MSLTVGSLCTGYGGLEMALEKVFGDINLAFVAENDVECSRLLEKRVGAPNLGDITKVDWWNVLESINDDTPDLDLVIAGYPCQPFSTAGQRKGEEDDRAIFEYVADAISVLRPRWVLLENVAGHLTLGGTSVIATLTRLGYDCRWAIVRASDTGSPHKRARLFIWANSSNTKISNGRYTQPEIMETTIRQASEFRESTCSFERWGNIIGRQRPEYATADNRVNPVFVEWLMGVPEGWVTGIGLPYSSQLRILGNGVVPQQGALAINLLSNQSTHQ